MAAGKASRAVLASHAGRVLPVPVDRLKAIVRNVAALLLAGGVLVALWLAQVPQAIGRQLGELAGLAGLTVKRVEIQGIYHMSRLSVYSVALDQTSTAMPLVDLEDIRQKLLKFGWVADARVSRRLPDTLLVDIVEREPAAIWQQGGRLALIDATGKVLAPVDPRAMPDLPLIVGPDANLQTAGLATVLAAAPRLKPLIAGASWVGGRRWDIRFQSGETLALPEGDEQGRAAFAKFDRMDQAARLLGQGFVRFDMRVPGRFVTRVSREPGAEVAAPADAAPPLPAPAGTDAI